MRQKITLAVVLAALVVGGLAVYKLRSAPEWTIVTGNPPERQRVCRAIWQKHAWRARWGLRRLLIDREPDVRLAAVEALSRRPLPKLLPLVQRLTDDSDPRLRSRAYEFILGPNGSAPEAAAAALYEKLQDAELRQANPALFTHLVRYRLEHRWDEASEWVLAALLRDRADYPEAANAVVRRAASLEPLRPMLVDALDDARDRPWRWEFIIAVLTDIDGRFRGVAAGDWRQTRVPTRANTDAGLDRFTVEAEWAYAITPNFQIDRHRNELCLHLGEGAGGYMAWLNRSSSTVDIGTGKFTFRLRTAGRYQLWLRIWQDDKCGNSAGIAIDGRALGNFSDYTDVFDRWRWVSAHREYDSVFLEAGRHALTVRAIEDAVFIDKYALLPASQPFRPTGPPPLAALYDPRSPTSISFTFEAQHQQRGTTQRVTVWVRRNSPDVAAGKLTLTVPPPFEVLRQSSTQIEFAPGSPLARSTFLLRLPPNAVAGEVELKAVLETEDRTVAVGRAKLGAHFDWYTTGPLDPNSPRALELLARTEIDRQELADGWRRYPAAGYDRYRRLDFEKAYGQQQNRVIFLYTEIEVGKSDRYTGFFTIDDRGSVWIDGKRVAHQPTNGPGEGRLMTEVSHLGAGRRRIFAVAWQADFPDPVGARADRMSYNHWVFKWLLRRSRHQLAPGIRGVVVTPGTAE